jgi:hypothetical protein
MNRLVAVICVLSLGAFALAGCSPDGGSGKAVGGHDEKGNEAHVHVHGPKGGETFAFEGTDIHGEWVARYGDNLVTFYLYGDDKKTEKPVAASKLTGGRKVKDVESFEIPAINLADGKASRFEIVDENFAIVMKTTGATLEVEIDGVKHSTQLEKDPHH